MPSRTGNRVLDLPFTITGSDITGYKVVELCVLATTDQKRISLAPDDDEFPIGVTQIDDDVTEVEGDVVPVRVSGVTKCIAYKAIDPGDQVAAISGAAAADYGKVTDVQPDDGDFWLGVAITDATAKNDELTVLLAQQQVKTS